ncbi:MAG: hypothetical protein ACRC1H_13680, partial [Caldilineaceae bacterium]
RTIHLPEGAAAMQSVRFEGVSPSANTLTILRDGEQLPTLQIVSEAWQPWPPMTGTNNQSMDVQVTYDRTELAVNDLVKVTATIPNYLPQPVNMLLVELALPPGFDVVREDWAALVAEGLIDRYEVRPAQINAYVSDVAAGETVSFTYRLQARLVVDVETGTSTSYDFYASQWRRTAPPQRIVVLLGN